MYVGGGFGSTLKHIEIKDFESMQINDNMLSSNKDLKPAMYSIPGQFLCWFD